jgi:hypothetical protein
MDDIAIYGPMIYTVQSVMLLMRADALREQVGGGWALEIGTFLGLVKWPRFSGLNPLPLALVMHLPASKSLSPAPYKQEVH